MTAGGDVVSSSTAIDPNALADVPPHVTVADVNPELVDAVISPRTGAVCPRLNREVNEPGTVMAGGFVELATLVTTGLDVRAVFDRTGAGVEAAAWLS
jgi:hypothetical protein